LKSKTKLQTANNLVSTENSKNGKNQSWPQKYFEQLLFLLLSGEMIGLQANKAKFNNFSLTPLKILSVQF
jgi:hypothetical protein